MSGVITCCTHCEWCDDEPCRRPEVLVAVVVLRVGHAHDAVVHVLVPVVAHLLLPLETVDVLHLWQNKQTTSNDQQRDVLIRVTPQEDDIRYILITSCGRSTFCTFYICLEGRKEMFYLTTHSTHFIYGYMASDIW